MPASSDERPSVPAPGLESEAPRATVEDRSTNLDSSIAPSQDGEQRPPRRRRRRRGRRPPLTAGLPDAPVADHTPTEEAPAAGGTAGDAHPEAQEPRPPRRRHRRGPARLAAPPRLPAAGDTAVDESGPPDPTAIAPGGEPPQGQSSPGVAGEPRRPRRRRRRPPRPAAAAAPGSRAEMSGGPETIAEAASHPGADGAARPRTGRSRPRRPREPGLQEGDARARGPLRPRERGAGPGQPGGRQPGRRDHGSDTRGRRDKGSGGRPPARGRGMLPRKPEPKLYALESVVDRGFEDVPDDSDEGGTRRVHWTIVKRTVADQKS